MAWGTPLKALVTLAVLCVGAGGADVFACGVNWRLPKDHFDGVNEYGVVSYWEQIGEIDLGDDLKLPLIIGFQSDRDWSSPYLGKGWILPLLDSNIVQVSENEFRQIQPDGYTINFGRDGKKPNVIRGQQGWTGEIKGDVITLYATCGWKLTYQQGKLTSITTPKNRVLSLLYSDGKVAELREQGRIVLQVNTDPATKQVTGVTYGKDKIGVALGDKPKVEVVAGQNVVGGMAKSLGDLQFSDGTRHTYQFGVNDKLEPLLKVGMPNSEPRNISWNPMNNQISSDNGWIYAISFPSKNTNAKIERTNLQGQSEMWFYDGEKGTNYTRDVSGNTTEHQWFTSGFATGRLRHSITYVSNGKRLERKLSYDERGNLIRDSAPRYTLEVRENLLVINKNSSLPIYIKIHNEE